ncbi:MAG: hypothetical protein AB7V27_03655 [Candidatus Binatia bacterium]
MVGAYDDAMSLRAARQLYFEANGFDGTYSDRWVRLGIGPVALYFPNAAGRKHAVKLHDLHHVLTGYPTTWTGEAEIAAFEIASGCRRFAWAWGLNIGGLVIGLAIAPRATFCAFVRGRHAGNLYRHGELRDALLECSVRDTRHALGLDRPAPAPGARDVAAFLVWALISLAASLGPLAVLLCWLA